MPPSSARPSSCRSAALKIAKPLLLWINDGLMAIFFLLVALEIKREVLDGELSSVEQAALPVVAAAGGMLVPAAVYLFSTAAEPGLGRGWAIPTATDIAFAVGVLALLGSRAPPSLKIFLLALAIIDDLGAIVIIAVFYTDNLSLLSLVLAALGIAGLVALNLRRRRPRGALRAGRRVPVGLRAEERRPRDAGRRRDRRWRSRCAAGSGRTRRCGRWSMRSIPG